jgi:two-component system phosphate regulon response regulator OmpR
MSDNPAHVLLVDDDADLRDLLRRFFQQRGFDFSVLHDATQLARRIERERPSIIVLDRMMPGIDGLTALKELRANNDPIPVIMLTARADDVDRVIGLELGADDYLGKPFLPQELLARVNAVLRRHSRSESRLPSMMEPGGICHFGEFKLDFTSRTLSRDDQPIKLTGSEYALLKVLAEHPMQTLSRVKLIELIYGENAEVTERGIDVPVWRLRRLLESDPTNPQFIRTVRGTGYVFVPGM